MRALKAEGFTRLTDGFGKAPYRRQGITCYPIAFRMKDGLRGSGVTTMVVHTNTMSDRDLKRYEQWFQSQEMISYGEYLEMEATKRGLAGYLTEYLMATIKRWLVRGIGVWHKLMQHKDCVVSEDTLSL